MSLKDLRTKRGWTQEQLAEKLGLDRVAITMYETHKREPVLDTLRKLSDIFDVSIDYLLEVKEHKNNETFGNRLKQKRKQFGYTQEDVAKKIGVQRVAYNRYESDTHEPNFDTFKKICKLFAVTSDYLLGIDDED